HTSVAMGLAPHRQLCQSVGQTVLFLFIGSEGRERGVVDRRSIALARTVTRKRRIHDHQIELAVTNSIFKIPYLLRTTSARCMCRGLNDLERCLFLQEVE